MKVSATTGAPKGKTRRSDHFDSPWREAMQGFLRSFVEFFFPDAAADIAWEEGVEILETELRQIAGKTRASPVRSDSLFRVRRVSGARQLVLIHGEVQTTRDVRLAERMFRYNYRSFDAQGLEVASFAILGDPQPGWRPGEYGWKLWGCEMGLRFPVVKLVDWLGREVELAASRNPFALVTQAFLSTRATRNDGALRRKWKIEIVRRLYEKGYSEEDVRKLFRVIDWMMQLPAEEAIIFMDELEQLEAEKSMRYVTSVERMILDRTRDEAWKGGRQEGLISLLSNLLVQRFGQLPEWVSAKLENAAPEALESWGRRIFAAGSLEEIFA